MNETLEPANLFLGVITGVIGSIGVPPNLCVIYLTVTTNTLRSKPHCWLIFNLALADLVFCLNNCLLESNQVMDRFRKDVLCKIAAFTEYTSGFTSFLVIPSIALNRFVILKNSGYLFSRRHFSSRSSVALYSIFSWLYSFATFSPFVVTSKLGQEELGLCGIIADGWLHIFWITAVAVPILMSYGTMFICYVRIIRLIRAHQQVAHHHNSGIYRESSDLVRVMLLICLIPLFAQLPAVFLKTLLPYFPGLNIWWSRAFVSPFPLTSACNPYIVLFVAKSYGSAFRQKFFYSQHNTVPSNALEMAEEDVYSKLVSRNTTEMRSRQVVTV